MQLDLLAGALLADLSHPVGVRLRSVIVQHPVRFTDRTPRTLLALGRPTPDGSAWDAALQSEDGTTHLRAVVEAAQSAADDVDATVPPQGRGTADLVYPPMFHGPAFQVIGRFGRDDHGLATEPSPTWQSWAVPGHGGVLPMHLLELALQSCGVWELAKTGRMMRPSTIAEVTVPVARADAPRQARVRVTPRRTSPITGTGTGTDPDHVFDGVAVDLDGTVAVRVHGYHPIELGHQVPPETSRKIREGASS